MGGGFWEHLNELRRLIVKSVAIYAFTYVLLLFLFPKIYNLILSASGAKDVQVYFFGVGDALGFYFTAPAVIGLLLVFPVVATMFYKWVEDALFPKERLVILRYARLSSIVFLLGVFMSFFLLPRVVGLSQYIGNVLGVSVLFSAREIFSIWLSMAVLLGLVFQFPLILSLLVRTGIVSKEVLFSVRAYAYLFFYVLSALITPGDLIVADIFLLALFIFLYELSIRLTPQKK